MAATNQIVITQLTAYGLMIKNVLINKRQVLHEFFDNMDILRQDFQHWVSFKSLFRVPQYSQILQIKTKKLLQVNFYGRILPG